MCHSHRSLLLTDTHRYTQIHRCTAWPDLHPGTQPETQTQTQTLSTHPGAQTQVTVAPRLLRRSPSLRACCAAHRRSVPAAPLTVAPCLLRRSPSLRACCAGHRRSVPAAPVTVAPCLLRRSPYGTYRSSQPSAAGGDCLWAADRFCLGPRPVTLCSG